MVSRLASAKKPHNPFQEEPFLSLSLSERPLGSFVEDTHQQLQRLCGDHPQTNKTRKNLELENWGGGGGGERERERERE